MIKALKSCLYRLLLLAAASFGPTAGASEQPAETLAVPQEGVAVTSVNAPCVPHATENRIRKVGIQLVTFLKVCQDDATKAGLVVTEAQQGLARTIQAQDDSLARLIVLCELLNGCGSHVSVGEKVFSKEEVATYLSIKLEDHQNLVKQEETGRVRLAEARQHHRTMLERLAKWKRQQDELIARVNAVRAAQAARRDSFAEAEYTEALSRVNELTEALNEQFASTPAVPSLSEETPEDAETVQQAAAEFDRLFGDKQR